MPILAQSGGDPKTMARFYLAIVQAKLLYGSETWCLSQSCLQRLERFHARCARHMAHRHIRPLANGEWDHPHTAEVLDRCGLSTIQTYIVKRRTTLLNSYALDRSPAYQASIHAIPAYSPIGRPPLLWWRLE